MNKQNISPDFLNQKLTPQQRELEVSTYAAIAFDGGCTLLSDKTNAADLKPATELTAETAKGTNYCCKNPIQPNATTKNNDSVARFRNIVIEFDDVEPVDGFDEWLQYQFRAWE